MGDVPQGRSTPSRRRRGTREAHGRHIQLGRRFPQGRPGHAVRAHIGSQLFGHQRPVGRHLQDGGQHDQRKDARGDQENVQHQERLHGRRRGSGTKRERMVRRKIIIG